jgi:hypothetical protein
MRISPILVALALVGSAVQATIDRPQGKAPAVSKAAPSPRSGRQPVEVEMSNVDLHVTADVTLRVHHLRGRFEPAGAADMPYLEDKLSYVVAIDSGEIALEMASLNALMTKTLGQGRSNVEKLRISTDEKSQLRQQGVLKKGIKVPFDVKGAVEATPDGRIRMHAAAVRGFGVPVNPLMKLLSLEMDDLLKVQPGHGVTVDNNDLILDPQQLVPPPLIRGKVTSVRVADGAIVQVFGSGERQRLSPPAVSRNYIYWRGGKLQFGKLTMTDTDLELVDEDPNDPFDFSIDQWNDQLVAGYSKNTPNKGLKAHMPDHNDLNRQTAGKH